MDFNDDFLHAFNHAMLYEVGKFWNPEDPDVIEGRIDTREQRRKVGYVNIPQDRGGETKYGVAQKANPQIRVRDLDLQGAMEVYFSKYWLGGACDKLPYPLTIMHFDGCVNHGPGRARKFLQRALGIPEHEVNGDIGPQTLSAVESMDQSDIISAISGIRADFYNAIVERDPTQRMFLNGWMTRINEVTDYTIKQLH